jgi:hypothetical protein
MRAFRGRSSVLGSFALTWQIVALMLVPTAACCQNGWSSPTAGETANCPMHHSRQDPVCAIHASSSADRDCHCPKLGCSPADNGFLALFGPVGVLARAVDTPALRPIGEAASPTPPSSNSLAPVPVAPPPRV